MKSKIKHFLEQEYNAKEIDYNCPFFGKTKAFLLNKEVGFNTGSDVTIQIETSKEDYTNLHLKFQSYSSYVSSNFEFQATIKEISELETLLKVIKW